jgi:hypothetical protein
VGVGTCIDWRLVPLVRSRMISHCHKLLKLCEQVVWTKNNSTPWNTVKPGAYLTSTHQTRDDISHPRREYKAHGGESEV